MKIKKGQIQQPLIDRHPLHPERKLVTRRDFLSSGVLSFGGAVMLPTVLDLVFLERAARAGVVGSANPVDMMPFVVFDLAGGNAIPNLPTATDGLNGELLPSYSRLGYADSSKWEADYRFGAPFARPNPLDPAPTIFSEIHDELIAEFLDPQTKLQPNPNYLPPAVQACLRMGMIAHTSLSDSGLNALSAVSLVTASGMQGSRVKGGLGMSTSPSAGNSEAASLDPNYRPMGIRSVEGLASALSYGPAFAGLPVKLKEAVAKSLLKLSESQGRRLASLSLGDQFAALVQSAFGKNLGYVNDVGGIDPRKDAIMQQIYALTANSNGGSQDAVIATLVKNTLDGNSGPAVITIGGCDYHDGTATSGAAKNREIGMQISRLIRAAAAKGKKVAFQMFTDGGISSDDSTRVWRGDDNDKSFTIFGVYDPAGGREMAQHQVGRYTDGQGADRTHYLGTDPQRVAHAVFLNYLALNGQADNYGKFAIGRDRILPVDEKALLKSLLLFPNAA